MLRFISPLLVASMLSGCFIAADVAPRSAASNPASPPAVLTDQHGPHDIVFDGCGSGAREFFFGVDMVSEAQQIGLRLLMDPIDGPRGKLVRPGHAPVTLNHDNCARFQLDVRRTGMRINSISVIEGEAHLGCVLGDDETFEADVVFDACY